jgi:hypothetical protein
LSEILSSNLRKINQENNTNKYFKHRGRIMMINLTQQQEQNFYNRALELIPRLRFIEGRLNPELPGLGRDVNKLVSDVSRALRGVATHSEFIHGRGDRTGGSVLPNAVTNGNISSELANILTDLYVASRITRRSMRSSDIGGARQRVLAILDHRTPSHAFFQPVASSSYQAQQPQYQRGGEADQRNPAVIGASRQGDGFRATNEALRRHRAGESFFDPRPGRQSQEATSQRHFQPVASSSYQAQQQPQYQRGQEPHYPSHSHSHSNQVLSEEFDGNLSMGTLEQRVHLLRAHTSAGQEPHPRQREVDNNNIVNQRLNELNAPQNTTRGTQTGTRHTGSTSIELPGGAIVSSSRLSRGNTDTVTGRELDRLLFNRTPSPEQQISFGRRR